MTRTISSLHRDAPALAIVIALITVNPAQAQLLEEVIVTAQKREQSAQDVGIAITAFSGEQLEQLRFDDSTDIARMTPGMFISPNEGGLKQLFTLRGVNQNDFAGQTESPVAVYVDESYIAVHQGQLFGLFDVDRVEVLKGPQGTLFGRNATGGLIHFVSRKPTPDPEGYLDVTYGSYDQVRVRGAMSGPFSESVSARAAVMYNRHDSILDNTYPKNFRTTTGTPLAIGGEDGWNDDTLALRGHLQLEPSADLDILLSGDYMRLRTGTPPYVEVASVPVYNAAGQQIDAIEAAPDEIRQGIGPGGVAVNVPNSFRPDAFRPVAGGNFYGATCTRDDIEDLRCSSDFGFNDINQDNMWSGTGKLTWNLEHFTLTAVSAYRYLDSFHALDADGGPATLLHGSNGQKRAETFAQEVRLDGDIGNLKWVTGIYYLNVDSSPRFGLGVVPESLWFPLFGVPANISLVSEMETDSWSVFGQFEYALLDSLTLIGGVRTTFEDKQFEYEETIFLSTNPTKLKLDAPLVTLTPRREFGQSATLWSGKLQLDWRPVDDVLIYAGVNRGVKAGGFNAILTFGAPFPESDIPYKEEVLLAYETGFKTELFGGNARLNGAIYYYDYKDYQGFIFRNATSFIRNADADYHGAELEFHASPADGLDVAFNLAYLDAEVHDVQIETGILRDTRPSFAPEWQVGGLVRYEWPAPLFSGTVSGQLDVSHSGSFYTDLRNFSKARLAGRTITNVSLGWRGLDGKWEATFFVDNVTDDHYRTLSIDLSGLFGSSAEIPGMPRWFGASLKYNFF